MAMRRQRRQLTQKEIDQLEAWSAVRLPMDQICQLLDIAETDLRDMINKNDTVRRALDTGRAKASLRVRGTLYERAVGRKAIYHEKTRELIEEAIAPDLSALKFWCQTQEGFKTADKLEISGPEGAPIETRAVTREELEARVARLRVINELTEDE